MDVPTFKTYYPSIGDMTAAQRRFYNHLVLHLDRNQVLAVDGNISYLFAYTYGIVETWRSVGFERLHQRLLALAEGYYHETSFAGYCRVWANECLIALKRYEKYLEVTEPENAFANHARFPSERCNINFLLGKPGHPLDVAKIFSIRFNAYTRKHGAAFTDFLINSFNEEAENNGPWLQRILDDHPSKPRFTDPLFAGFPGDNPEVGIPVYPFYASHKMGKVVAETIRKAENALRVAHKMPLVGEGWISETELYYAIKNTFPQTPVIQHGRPDWLGNQHLDVWIPNWKIAVEYHGTQHFEPVEIFGGIEGFEATQRRDQRKILLCRENGVELVVTTADIPTEDVLANIRAIHEIEERLPLEL